MESDPRIELLRELLRKAAECGMQNPNYFFRLFRQQTGMTPNQYRESSRKQRMGARGYSLGDYQPPSRNSEEKYMEVPP